MLWFGIHVAVHWLLAIGMMPAKDAPSELLVQFLLSLWSVDIWSTFRTLQWIMICWRVDEELTV